MTAAFIRPSQVAEYASVSLRTVYNWIKQKRLPSKVVGRVRLIKLSDLQKLLEGNAQ